MSKFLVLFVILIYCLRFFSSSTVALDLGVVYLFLKKNLHWGTGAGVLED